MITSNCSLTSIGTRSWRLGFPGLPAPELHAEAAPGGEADDVVVGTADGARPALDAVSEAHDGLSLLVIPLVDAGGAEVVAVLPGALVPADVLVGDLDVRMPRVLHIPVGEQLVRQLLHRPLQDRDIRGQARVSRAE